MSEPTNERKADVEIERQEEEGCRRHSKTDAFGLQDFADGGASPGNLLPQEGQQVEIVS